MTDAKVVQLHEPNDVLAEERSAARVIVSGIRNGDAAAEERLCRRYEKKLYFIVVRRIGDPELARDTVQEVLAIAIKRLRTRDLEDPERLAGFLRGIAENTINSDNRKRRRDPILLDVDAVEALPDSEFLQYRTIAAEQTRLAVHSILAELKVDRDRDLLMRYYVYDEDKDRICRELGIDRSYFNRVLFRAKARFRKCLEDSGYGGLGDSDNDD